ncbi:MAG TPA: LacI family DNA-binding transcriptional regulator, partial [Polyangia bacterium]|nr:LacI family DNA-binding transcriptional regulator [Polyangia bacterium]
DMAKKRTTSLLPGGAASRRRPLTDHHRDERGASSKLPATLQQVATHSGFSRSTVSNVVNGLSEKVSLETFQRVTESIRLFNYRPNTAARLLRSGHARPTVLGLLVPSIAHPFYASLARALDQATRQQGFSLVLRNTNSDPATEHGLVEEFIADGVRCVALASSTAEESHLQGWIDRGLCIVSFDRLASAHLGLPMDTVSLDNFHAARTATRHLIENGHTAIAYATQPIMTRAMTCLTRSERRDGYLAAMKEVGQEDNALVLELPVAGKHPDTALSASGRQVALKLIGRRNRPTGIVCMNDLIAFSLVAGLHGAGVRVPDDISLVGIDGLSLDALATPPLTSMHQPLAAIAEATIERMQARLSNPHLPAAQQLLKADLVIRASVKSRTATGAVRTPPNLIATPTTRRRDPAKA